jgi:hypothetical protein
MVCASARATSSRRLSARRVALHLARGRTPSMVAELEEADLAAVDAILERPGFSRLVAHYRALAGLSPEKRREHLACLAWDELLLRLEEGDETAVYFVFRMEEKRRRPEEVLADRVIAQEEKALAGRSRQGSVLERVHSGEPGSALPPAMPSSAPLSHALASFELRLVAAEASEASGSLPSEPTGQSEAKDLPASDPCFSEGNAAGLPASAAGRQEEAPGLAGSMGLRQRERHDLDPTASSSPPDPNASARSRDVSEDGKAPIASASRDLVSDAHREGKEGALPASFSSGRRRHRANKPGSPRIMGKANAGHPAADPWPADPWPAPDQWKDCFLGLAGYKASPRDLLANTAIPPGEQPAIRPQDPLAFLPTFHPRSQNPLRDYKNLLLRGTFIGFDPITAWDCSPDRLFDHTAQPQGP